MDLWASFAFLSHALGGLHHHKHTSRPEGGSNAAAESPPGGGGSGAAVAAAGPVTRRGSTEPAGLPSSDAAARWVAAQ